MPNDDDDIKLKVGVDTSPAEKGFKKLMKNMEDLSKKHEKIFKQVANKLHFVGEGSTSTVTPPKPGSSGDVVNNRLVNLLEKVSRVLGVSKSTSSSGSGSAIQMATRQLLTTGSTMGFVVAPNSAQLGIFLRMMGYSHTSMNRANANYLSATTTQSIQHGSMSAPQRHFNQTSVDVNMHRGTSGALMLSKSQVMDHKILMGFKAITEAVAPGVQVQKSASLKYVKPTSEDYTKVLRASVLGEHLSKSEINSAKGSQKLIQLTGSKVLSTLLKEKQLSSERYNLAKEQLAEENQHWESTVKSGGLTPESANAHQSNQAKYQALIQAELDKQQSINTQVGALTTASTAELPSVGGSGGGGGGGNNGNGSSKSGSSPLGKWLTSGSRSLRSMLSSSDPFQMLSSGLSSIPVIGSIAGVAAAIEGLAKNVIPTIESMGQGYAQTGGNYAPSQYNAYQSQVLSGARSNLRRVSTYTESATSYMQASGQTMMGLIFPNVSVASQFARAMGIGMNSAATAAGQMALYGSTNIPGTLSSVLGATLASGVNPAMFLQSLLQLDQTGTQAGTNISSSGNAALLAGMNRLGNQTGLSFLQGSRGGQVLQNIGSAMQNPLSGANEIYTFKAIQQAYASAHGGQMPGVLTTLGLQQEGPMAWGPKSPTMLGAYIKALSGTFGNTAYGHLMTASTLGLSIAQFQALQKRTGGNWTQLTAKDLQSVEGKSANPATAAQTFAKTLAGAAANVSSKLSAFSFTIESVALKFTNVVMKLATDVTNWVSKLSSGGTVVNKVFDSISGFLSGIFSPVLHGVVSALQTVSRWFKDLVRGTRDVYDWFRKLSGLSNSKKLGFWGTVWQNSKGLSNFPDSVLNALAGAAAKRVEEMKAKHGSQTSSGKNKNLGFWGTVWQDTKAVANVPDTLLNAGALAIYKRLGEIRANHGNPGPQTNPASLKRFYNAYHGDIAKAAYTHGVSPQILMALQQNETGSKSTRGALTAVNRDIGRNGQVTYDRGLFQINTVNNGLIPHGQWQNPQYSADAAASVVHQDIGRLVQRGLIPADWSTTKNMTVLKQSLADIFQAYNQGPNSLSIPKVGEKNFASHLSRYANNAMENLSLIEGQTGMQLRFTITLPNGKKVNAS